jgi:hypothetical protein
VCTAPKRFSLLSTVLTNDVYAGHVRDTGMYRTADKPLAPPTSLSVVFSVQVTGGSPMGPDPENRVGDQDIASPDWPVASG